MSGFLLKTVELIGHNLITSGVVIFLGIIAISISRRWWKSHAAKKLFQKSLAAGTFPNLYPEVDHSLCGGCGTCVSACPEGEILRLINHKSTLVQPMKCIGHGACERACPRKAIRLVYGSKERGVDIPRISANFETNVPGLYIAGELGGMGLINNAIKQGHLAAKHAIETLDNSKSNSAEFDLCIIGAGPAGFAAALTAIAKRRKYILLEQGTFGGTVANYPKQKLVMTAPVDLPLAGKIAFNGNKVTKEQLMHTWKNIANTAKLRIVEKTTFSGVEPKEGGFKVKTSKGDISARKVILALGLRGSPRKLDIANEDIPKVTYSLSDAKDYVHRDIAVVGAGNSAVEAAYSLSDPKLANRVTLIVRKGEFSRCKEENVANIQAREKQRLVRIMYNSQISSVDDSTVEISQQGKKVSLPNNFLFVLIGAEMPFDFLRNLGIIIDKKYGEPVE